MAKPRFHLKRSVRLHATGQWVCTIGRAVTKSGRLADKVWYWPPTLTEEQAKSKADEKAAEWRRLCLTWATAHMPYLRILEMPFADQPHWPSEEHRDSKAGISPDQLAAIRREGKVDDEELAQAYAESPSLS